MLFTATAEKYLFKRQRGQLSRIPSHNRPKFYLTDSITGYSGVIIELIEKGLLFAFFKFCNSPYISFSITLRPEFDSFSGLFYIDYTTLLYDLKRGLFTGYPGIFRDLSIRIILFGLSAGLNACKRTFYKFRYYYT
jgi:hypothetical protein